MPIKNAPIGSSTAHPAVTATRPANAPFRMCSALNFPVNIFETKKAVTEPTAPAIDVLTTIFAILPSPIRVLPPLKPNQPNQSINAPKQPSA